MIGSRGRALLATGAVEATGAKISPRAAPRGPWQRQRRSGSSEGAGECGVRELEAGAEGRELGTGYARAPTV